MDNRLARIFGCLLLVSLIFSFFPNSNTLTVNTLTITQAQTTGYSISGRVTDSGGNGIGGVTLTAIDQTNRTEYQPEQEGFNFDNTSYSTNWQIFKDTFGADNVEFTVLGVTYHRPAADIYYHWHYKCDGLFATCEEVGAHGNCDGMASSSMVIHNGWVDPSDFLEDNGAEYTIDLSESQTVKDFIVRYQGYQNGQQISSERSSSASRSLSENLALIKAGIDNGLTNPYRIGIRDLHLNSNGSQACAGHSLMPYAYWEEGDETHVLVYDSNNPSSNNQIITINTSANTWVYNHNNSLGTWHNNVACAYSGGTSLIAIPASAYAEHPLPPWKNSGSFLNTGESINLFTGGLGTKVLITDDSGRRVGYVGTELMLEIPGSYKNIPEAVIPGEDFSYPDEYVIPGLSGYNITLNNSESSSIAFMGILPSGIVEVSGESSTLAASDLVQIENDLSIVSVSSGSDSTERSLSVTTDSETEGRTIMVNNFDLLAAEHATLNAQLTDYELSFTSSEDQSNYSIALMQSGDVNGLFYGTVPVMQGGDTHYVSLDWQDPSLADVNIDHNNDGVIDETVVIENELQNIYLPFLTKAETGLASEFSTVTETRSTLSTLSSPSISNNVNKVQVSSFTAITDINGNFTLLSIPAGQYSISAYKIGFDFYPSSRIINIPPNAANQDFVGITVNPDVLWDQPLSIVNTTAYVNQDFPDYPSSSSFLADDFVVDALWQVDGFYIPGDGWNGFSTLLNASQLTFMIYADNMGVPAGDPTGRGNPPVWALSISPTDPHLTISTGWSGYPSNVQLDLDSPIPLPVGHYWFIFYPTMVFNPYGQYGRQPSDTTNGYTGQFVNPGNGFELGTEWQSWGVVGATTQDAAFSIYGAESQSMVPTSMVEIIGP